MTIAAITSIATSGMQAQSTYLTATANNVANAMTPGYKQLDTSFTAAAGGGVSAEVKESSEANGVDLDDQMLGLVFAKTAFEANASVFETGADMWQMLASIAKD